jgi:hypothetical protein
VAFQSVSYSPRQDLTFAQNIYGTYAFLLFKRKRECKKKKETREYFFKSVYGSVNRDSSVGIAMDCGIDLQGSIPGKCKRFFSTLQRPDRLWNPPSLSSNEYRELFLGGKATGA